MAGARTQGFAAGSADAQQLQQLHPLAQVAVGSAALRKRVFGAVKFVEDCFAGVVPHKRLGNQAVPMRVYDFGELRHKLGLEYVSAPPPDVKVPAEEPKPAPAPAPPAAPARREIGAMNAAELAGLDVAKVFAESLLQNAKILIHPGEGRRLARRVHGKIEHLAREAEHEQQDGD